MHITLAQAFDALKASTHSSITLKYNPIGFSEMLLHPEKSPHRNKKNFTNNNKAYLIEYLKQQQNNYHSSLQVPNGGGVNSNASSANSSPKIGEESSNLSPQEAAAVARVSQTGKKSIGSIPPLPPQAHHGMQTSTNSLTPRNKSKDSTKSSHFKLANFSSNSNSNANNSVNTKQPNDSSSSNQIKKIFNRFNRKPHSKELEGLAQGDSSAPSLKSITRSPSPSLSNFHHHHSTGGGHSNTSSFSGSILFGKSSAALQQQQNSKLLTNSMSDYVAGLSRNNSATNLNDSTGGQQQNQHSFENSFAKMGLLDQHEFVGKHVLKIYKNDQNFKYLVVHKVYFHYLNSF